MIVETLVAILYKNKVDYLDILKFMDDQEFKLLDILYLAYYKDWKGLMWTDLVFIPKDKNFNYS